MVGESRLMKQQKSPRFRHSTMFFGLAGIGLLIWLLVNEGIGTIFAAFSLIGLNIIWIGVYRIFPILVDANGWRHLYLRENTPAFREFSLARWLGESVNTLLPVGQLGGHYVRARLLGKRHNHPVEAAATVTVDFTVGLSTQIIFTFMGFALLLIHIGYQDSANMLLIGILIAVFAVAGFFVSQKAGLFGTIVEWFKLFSRSKTSTELLENALLLDQRIREIYQRRSKLLICFLWRLTGWVAKSGENWIILYLIGVSVTWKEALIIESLTSAFRSAAFFVPAGLGVQDGGLLYVGMTIGIDSTSLLTLALAKRFRELMVGIPGLQCWFFLERKASLKLQR